MKDISVESIVVSILEKSDSPIHISVVIDEVLKVKHYNGKTPRKTVNALIQRSERIVCENRYCKLLD